MLQAVMTREQRLAEMEACVAKLSEVYDAVQIVGTWLDEAGRTFGQKRGCGNWYARQQLCREFIEEDIAESNAKAIANKLDPPDEWKQS